MSEDIPEYSDVKVEDDEDLGETLEDGLDGISKHVDYLKNKKKQELQSQLNQLDDEDSIDLPETYDVAAHKYDLNADENRPFHGVHVVNSNTKRVDNFRHLQYYDLQTDYSLIPTRSHLIKRIDGRVMAEFQMCRSNPEIGGFDRRLQRSVLKREDVDVKQTQTLSNLSKPEKRGILNFLRRKK